MMGKRPLEAVPDKSADETQVTALWRALLSAAGICAERNKSRALAPFDAAITSRYFT